MSKQINVVVPAMGDFNAVDVIEILVSVGDTIAVDDALVTLESDKASMEVPSSHAGIIREIKIAVGDQISAGDTIVVVESNESVAELVAQDTSAIMEKTDTIAEGSAEVYADVVVLGAGPGGYTAAFRAADLGKKVILIERYADLGGVCLNVGCIPSKALLHVAKVLDETQHAKDWGITWNKPTIDIDKIRSWKSGVVTRLTGGLKVLAEKRNVQVIQGEGKFVSPQTIQVTLADAVTNVRFDNAIIAAGSKVTKIPGFPYDDPRLIDSTGALALQDVPTSMLIIGGGIIGLEMATVYHALGSEITIVEWMDHLIPGCDKDLVRPLHKRIKNQYKNIYLTTKVTAIEPQAQGLMVTFEGKSAPEKQCFDRVLVAVGRRPNGAAIGANNAGIEVNEHGFIEVDKQQRTNVPHIFAIGDIVGQPMLAHKAAHEGKVAAEVCTGLKSAFDARVIPSVAYTDPEVAWVGVTETEAKAADLDYGKGVFPWAASGRSLSLGRDEGLTKILFDKESNRVIGMGIVGPHAGDLIAEGALAIEMGCDATDIGLTVHPHPTLSETVAMAAEAFEGTITDLYLPRRS